MVEKKTSGITAALVTLVLGTAGGALFLQKSPEPTLREVYAACEKGELRGLACCEDLSAVQDWRKPLETCGMIGPGEPDPLGIRKQLEDAFDKALSEGK